MEALVDFIVSKNGSIQVSDETYDANLSANVKVQAWEETARVKLSIREMVDHRLCLDFVRDGGDPAAFGELMQEIREFFLEDGMLIE